MTRRKTPRPRSTARLRKTLTGIQGLDEITGGGLPSGRPTLVSGGAGSGKTLFGLEFLVRGATQYGEPGVFMSFEETIPDLAEERRVARFRPEPPGGREEAVPGPRVTSRAARLRKPASTTSTASSFASPTPSSGSGRSASSWTRIEALFGELPNPGILRAEIRRLFGWLKQKGLTTVITAERDRPDKLTRHGIEEFVSDCVIVLDHRIREEISTRRLRIVKYRGSTHGTNEYPFLIDEHGISVLPISSLGLDHAAPDARISTGIDAAGRHAGRQGLFSGQQHPAVRHVRHRQDQRGGAFRGCRLPPRRALPVFRVRGIAAADRPQHALDRHRPRAVGPQGPAAIPGGAPHVRRHRSSTCWSPTNTSSSFKPSVVVVDPITNLLIGQHAERSAVDAHAAGRFSEDRSRSPRCSPV